jgi:hypothetical protein
MFKLKYEKREIKDDFPSGFGGGSLSSDFNTNKQVNGKMNCQLGIFSKDEFFRRVRTAPKIHKVSIEVRNQNCGLLNYTCVLSITGTKNQIENCMSYIKAMLY